MTIALGTTFVLPDEPCLNLSEVNLRTPDSRGIHRYQVLTVVRNDRPAEHRIDMGPDAEWTSPQFRIPGGYIDSVTRRLYIEHSVAELQEYANQYREKRFDYSEHPVADLIAGYRAREARKGKV